MTQPDGMVTRPFPGLGQAARQTTFSLLTTFLQDIPSWRSSLKINTHRRWRWVPHPPDLPIRTALCHLLLIKLSQAQNACPHHMPTAKQMEERHPPKLPAHHHGGGGREPGPTQATGQQPIPTHTRLLHPDFSVSPLCK